MPIQYTFKNRIAALGAAACLALSPMSSVAETLADKGAAGGLTVAFYNYNPNSYFNDAGELIGTDPDTLMPVLEAMGLKVASMLDTEWGNLIPGLHAGRFDLVAAGMYITPARCKQVAFSAPIFGLSAALALPKGNPHGITGIEDFATKGLTVSVLAGSAYVDFAKLAKIPDEKIMQLPDAAAAVAAIRAGRADAYFIDAAGIKAIVTSLPEQDFEMSASFSDIGGKIISPHGAFAFRKQDAAFVEEFNKFLQERLKQPEHVAMLERHGMSEAELPRFTAAELCEGMN